MCTADLGFTGGKNDIGAGTDTDFIGACRPALTVPDSVSPRSVSHTARSDINLALSCFSHQYHLVLPVLFFQKFQRILPIIVSYFPYIISSCFSHMGSCSSRLSQSLFLTLTLQFCMLIVPLLQSGITFFCTAPKIHSPIPFLIPTLRSDLVQILQTGTGRQAALCTATDSPTKEVVVLVIMTMMCRFHCVAVPTGCQAAPTYRVHLSARLCQDGIHSRFESIPQPIPNYIPARYRLPGCGSDRYCD